LGLEAIEEIIQKRLIEANEWNFFNIGGAHKVRRSPLFFIKRYQDIDWKEYVSLVRKSDLALVLTDATSFFPAYHPFDPAACGAVVVTDFLGEKQVRAISKNIIYSRANIGDLVQGLSNGAVLAQNMDLRRQNFRKNEISNDWRMSLQDCLQAIKK
jgi:WsaF, C-terminal domain